MSKINDGGPAFPSEQHETQDGTWNQTFERGMTLRDYFAGQALAGLMASEADGGVYLADHAALRAYEFADAMLKARESGHE